MATKIKINTGEINVFGWTVVSTEQQEELHSDLELSGAELDRGGQTYEYFTKTTTKYPNKSGKSITGIHCGYEIITSYGSFKCEDGIKGSWPSIIVFLTEGTGHIFHLLLPEEPLA